MFVEGNLGEKHWVSLLALRMTSASLSRLNAEVRQDCIVGTTLADTRYNKRLKRPTSVIHFP